MSNTVIRVGIIGADTKASWAGRRTPPRWVAQPQFALAAVTTRHEDIARSAAEAFGAQRRYAEPLELVPDPSIDLVTVTVKVPAHRELVLAALAADKAVYAKSPLGAPAAETEETADAAGSLHTAIGLQVRLNPSVRRATEIVEEGRLGRVRSVRGRRDDVRKRPGVGERTSTSTRRPRAPVSCRSLWATSWTSSRRFSGTSPRSMRTELLGPQVTLVGTGAISLREVPDHLDVIVRISSDAPVLVGVRAPDAHFSLEVRGPDGWLKLTGNHPADVPVGDLALSSNVDFTAPDSPAASGAGPTAAETWNGVSINMGVMYASLARDILNGTHHTPGLGHDVHNGCLTARGQQAARTSHRQS